MDQAKKIVLAYSGGLDTSVILKWLSNEGFKVFCFIGNVGQKENFKEIEKKSFKNRSYRSYNNRFKERICK